MRLSKIPWKQHGILRTRAWQRAEKIQFETKESLNLASGATTRLWTRPPSAGELIFQSSRAELSVAKMLSWTHGGGSDTSTAVDLRLLPPTGLLLLLIVARFQSSISRAGNCASDETWKTWKTKMGNGACETLANEETKWKWNPGD